MPSNTVLSSECCLISALPPILSAYFLGKFFGEFHATRIHARAKRICSLLNAVYCVLSFVSKLKMIRIAASSIVLYRTFVQHKRTFWNWSFVQHIAHDMRPNWNVHSRIQNAVSVICGTCPKPAPVQTAGFIHLRPEPFWNRWGKSLRIEVVEDNFWLCSIHSLLCRFRAVTGRAGTPFTLSVCPS